MIPFNKYRTLQNKLKLNGIQKQLSKQLKKVEYDAFKLIVRTLKNRCDVGRTDLSEAFVYLSKYHAGTEPFRLMSRICKEYGIFQPFCQGMRNGGMMNKQSNQQ